MSPKHPSQDESRDLIYMQYTYYIYIMSSKYGVIYIGVTNDLESRVLQHKQGENEGFTKKYNCHKLVYYEGFDSIEHAIMREKQLKKWRRSKKEFLIDKINSEWKDLANGWYN